MSHKLLYLTTHLYAKKICFHAEQIVGLQERDRCTLVLTPGPEDSDIPVAEPYDQVLRMWGEALSEQS